METPLPVTISHHDPGLSHKKAGYSALYSRFIALTLICSVAPLMLVGLCIYNYYASFSIARMSEYFQNQAQDHQKVIELFLKERVADLQLIAFGHSLTYCSDPKNLKNLFSIVNRDRPFFEDLGVIDDRGRHYSYAGPFEATVMASDYSVHKWFSEVMQRGVYISDMFAGYREIPHFIIAVTSSHEDRKWILRATIQTDLFSALVENVKMGRTGEVYLVNREGVLQSTPRLGGKIMEKAKLPMDLFTDRSGVRILDSRREGGQEIPSQIVAYTWLENPAWMLTVKQDYAEAFQQVNHANRAMVVFLLISVLAIMIVSFLTTRHMIGVIKKRDQKADELNSQLVHASKLASLGELAAGVAHEINNPLAIILTGNQVIRDFADENTNLDNEFREQLTECLAQSDSQILRCNIITHNLLRFARHSSSVREPVNINDCIGQVVELMDKRAKSDGISFEIEHSPDLPPIMSDPSQLQQVLVNLIANAIDAHEGKPYGTIYISTRNIPQRGGIEVLVRDTGSGIPPDVVGRIFDPFFTTKPVGKGTGLGLSITYSIIKNLGGGIRVESSVGKGAEFTIFLPSIPPGDLGENSNRERSSDEKGQGSAG